MGIGQAVRMRCFTMGGSRLVLDVVTWRGS